MLASCLACSYQSCSNTIPFFSLGNFLPSWQDPVLIGKGEALYQQHGAFCLETQIYPNAINQQSFGLKTILNPGEIYYHQVVYKFGARK